MPLPFDPTWLGLIPTAGCLLLLLRNRAMGKQVASLRVKKVANRAAAISRATVPAAAMDALPAMITCQDSEGRLLYLSARAAAVYGVQGDAIVGLMPSEALGRKYDKDIAALDWDTLKSGNPSPPFEQTVKDRDGRVHRWLSVKVPVKNDSGQVLFLATLSHDLDSSFGAAAEQSAANPAAAGEASEAVRQMEAKAKAAMAKAQEHEQRAQAALADAERKATALIEKAQAQPSGKGVAPSAANAALSERIEFLERALAAAQQQGESATGQAREAQARATELMRQVEEHEAGLRRRAGELEAELTAAREQSQGATSQVREAQARAAKLETEVAAASRMLRERENELRRQIEAAEARAQQLLPQVNDRKAEIERAQQAALEKERRANQLLAEAEQRAHDIVARAQEQESRVVAAVAAGQSRQSEVLRRANELEQHATAIEARIAELSARAGRLVSDDGAAAQSAATRAAEERAEQVLAAARARADEMLRAATEETERAARRAQKSEEEARQRAHARVQAAEQALQEAERRQAQAERAYQLARKQTQGADAPREPAMAGEGDSNWLAGLYSVSRANRGNESEFALDLPPEIGASDYAAEEEVESGKIFEPAFRNPRVTWTEQMKNRYLRKLAFLAALLMAAVLGAALIYRESLGRFVPPQPGKSTSRPAAAPHAGEEAKRVAEIELNRQVQEQLVILGFEIGAIDGQPGPQTRAAVRMFQVEAGLAQDGAIDADLLARLRKATGDFGRGKSEPAGNAKPR
jgi:PAS domain S-box-containing protein